MWIKVRRAIGLLLMVVGVCAFLYPDIASLLQKKQSEQSIIDFEKYYKTGDYAPPQDPADTQEGDGGGDGTENGTDGSGEMEFKELYDAIVEYNREIYESGQADFKDAWCYTQSPVDIDCLDNELFGYIEIPAMDVKLPLYIGASTSNMAKGATVMGQTSIPIGGENTNSVIAGHRGYRGSPYFREIEKLEVGDYVYITNPWETLIYKAVEIQIIGPYDSDQVKIREGEDLITLLTCHPYMSGGKYRYLVICEHVMDDGSATSDIQETVGEGSEVYTTLPEGEDIGSSQDLIDNEKMLRRVSAVIIFVFLLIALLKGRRKKEAKS